MDLGAPQIMGVLNVTPDSFSDGGLFLGKEPALRQAESMLAQGAAIIDVGGESTRPGAQPVSEQEELDRVLPVVEALVASFDVVISVDTSTPSVMRAAVQAGAGMINDVRSLQRPNALKVASALDVPICLMHMQGEPSHMQDNPNYSNVVAIVSEYLLARVENCVSAGIQRDRLLVDPGFGFGKTTQHNLSLLKHLGEFQSLGLPVLVGMSRKSMIGAVVEKPPAGRVYGSVAAALLALQAGANIIRVHDVGPTMDAIKILRAVAKAE